jgi:hypothetical protein
MLLYFWVEYAFGCLFMINFFCVGVSLVSLKNELGMPLSSDTETNLANPLQILGYQSPRYFDGTRSKIKIFPLKV